VVPPTPASADRPTVIPPAPGSAEVCIQESISVKVKNSFLHWFIERPVQRRSRSVD
jgi:hypothetical protein